MKGSLPSLAGCFVGSSLLLAAELSAATNTPAAITGALVFGVTDDLPSSDPTELLNDSYLVSTNFCQFVIYNRGSNTEPLWVPRPNLSPFKIELRDSKGKSIQMTRFGIDVSKPPRIQVPASGLSYHGPVGVKAV